MRWKFETIKKGEGRDRKEKERKIKETIKCYHLAGASPGDETANEPKVLQSPAFNSNQTDNHPRRPCPSAEIVPSKQGWVGVPAPDHAAHPSSSPAVAGQGGGEGTKCSWEQGENTPTCQELSYCLLDKKHSGTSPKASLPAALPTPHFNQRFVLGMYILLNF